MLQSKTINKFQHFPFHLVDPSSWPILTSFSLLNLTIGAVSYVHGYPYGGYILTLGFILTVGSIVILLLAMYAKWSSVKYGAEPFNYRKTQKILALESAARSKTRVTNNLIKKIRGRSKAGLALQIHNKGRYNKVFKYAEPSMTVALAKQSLTTNLINILAYIISIFIFINIILFLYDIYNHSFNINSISNLIPQGDTNDSVPMDPVRWWPSGVPQGMVVVGTALATFAALSRVPGISNRSRLLGSLASAGVSSVHVTYQSAVENSVGFNRLMWSWDTYNRTGIWPSLDEVAKNTSDKQIKDFTTEAVKLADTSKVDSIISEVSGSSNNFLPSSNFDYSAFVNKLIDTIFKESMQILKPVHVQGYFDDLIGQRIFIELILFILCICIFVLFLVFLFNLIFLLNKDKIIKNLNNKFITFYINYQAFFSKISLFILPIIILTSLFTLCHGLHWLITHQIPYESLDVDLHKFLSSKK